MKRQDQRIIETGDLGCDTLPMRPAEKIYKTIHDIEACFSPQEQASHRKKELFQEKAEYSTAPSPRGPTSDSK